MNNPVQTQQRIGKIMIYLAWILLLGLLSLFFHNVLLQDAYPNRDLGAHNEQGAREVVLQRNRSGHYIAPGFINGQSVRFLLDTGATSVSIPAATARRLGLKRGRPGRVSTANGVITVYSTALERISLGNISLSNVRAHINPHMPGETVLLGMSFMKHLEMIQRGNTLTLRQ